MFRLVGLVVSIGLADSLNPSTIAPALYLASGEAPRRHVLSFALGVFLVYFLGGALIALGPGQLLLSIVPKPDHEDRQVIETVAGAAVLVGAIVLWRFRHRLADKELPGARAVSSRRRTSAILGATITVVELPTAFPYFAVIAAIVGSGFGVVHQIILLLVFNVCFVLPLFAIIVTLIVARDHADRWLTRARQFGERNWPAILAIVGILAGALVMVLGITGLGARTHGRFGRFLRHVNHFLHP